MMLMGNDSQAGVGAALGSFALAAFVALLLLIASALDDNKAGAYREYPFDGLWSSVDSYVGFSLVVLEDWAEDGRWYFLVEGGLEAECMPRRLNGNQTFSFKHCETFDDLFTDFEVTLPDDPRGEARLRLTYDDESLQTRLRQVAPRLEPPASSNVELAWQHEQGDECLAHTGLWADAGLVFAPCAGGIVEVLDGRTGRLLGKATLEGARGSRTSGFLEATARDGILFAASTSRGLLIYDVKDPARPRLIGQFYNDQGRDNNRSVTNIHNLTLSPKGDLLFLMNTSHARPDVLILDVSDPTQPKEAGKYVDTTSASATSPHDIAIEERDGRLIAYLNLMGGQAGRFQILDVTNPATPAELGSIQWPGMFSHSGAPFRAGNRFFFAHTDEGYDQALTVLDVTDLARPSIVSRFQSREGASIHNLRVVNGVAYVSYYIDGLRLIDLRNPEQPREVGHYDTVPNFEEWSLFGGAWGVQLDGGLVYISDRESGIYAFRVTLPR
jgi:choice-of-anchor B domain-containing protein